MEVDIDEDDMEGFSESATQRLAFATRRFVTDVVEEANRLEATQNTSGHAREITGPMVDDAALMVRKGFAKSRRKTGVLWLRISAAVATLLSGALFEFDRLANPVFAVSYIVLVAGTVLLVAFAILQD